MDRSSPAKGVVVTGASTGIGKAAVVALAAQGFRIFAGVRTAQAGESLRAAAPARAQIEALELDITRPEQIRAAAAAVAGSVGAEGLWGLFNNAGISVNGPLECLPIDELRRQFEVNVIGQVAVTQAFLPLLRQGSGRIVTTGSVAGFMTVPGLGPYAMSKHAMEAFTDCLRRELRPWGISVSLLQPGAVATEIWQKGHREFDELLQHSPPQLRDHYGPLIAGLRRAASQSERRAAPPELIAQAVVHAFTAARPKTRYCLGTDAGVQRWLSRLPDRWTDTLLAKVLGLR